MGRSRVHAGSSQISQQASAAVDSHSSCVPQKLFRLQAACRINSKVEAAYVASWLADSPILGLM
eukprot:6423737-Amphidinium_carterae.2